MSSSETETSAIDDKKDEANGTTTEEKELNVSSIGNFMLSLLITIVVALLYICFGGVVLYACKIAQANILPTETDCMPYKGKEATIKEIPINIFTTNFWVDPQMSEKIKFPYDKNKKNIIIDMLRKMQDKSKDSAFSGFIVEIIEGILSFNYNAMNLFFNILNQTCPEPVIIFIGPIITTIYLSLFSIFSNLYFIYVYFSKFMKFITDKDEQIFNIVSPNLWIGFFIWIMLIILFFILMCVGIVPFFVSILGLYATFSTFGCKGVMNEKEVGVGKIIMDIFKYYKVVITSIISIFIVTSSISNLGIIPGLISLLVIIGIYFGLIPLGIFIPIKQEQGKMSLAVSYDQANKECYIPKEAEMSNMFKGFLGTQKGGGNFVKEIKKIGKKISGNN